MIVKMFESDISEIILVISDLVWVEIIVLIVKKKIKNLIKVIYWSFIL